MTPTHLQACLDQIGWSQRHLAEMVGHPEVTIRRWAVGEYPIPEEIARWLQRLAALHLHCPPPPRAKPKRAYRTGSATTPVQLPAG